MADESTTAAATTAAATTTTTTAATTAATTTTAASGAADAAALQAQLEAARAEAAKNKAAAEELERVKAKQAADEKKRLEEQGEWKTLAEQRAADVKARDLQIVRERVRSTAMAAGLIDADLATMIASDESMIANGAPDQAKIDAAVGAFKGAKAHLFKAASSGAPTGAPGTPPPAEPPAGGKFDFTKPKNRAEAEQLYSQAKSELLRH
jgi:ribosome-binding protein aMBF1 (putative translation factor)